MKSVPRFLAACQKKLSRKRSVKFNASVSQQWSSGVGGVKWDFRQQKEKHETSTRFLTYAADDDDEDNGPVSLNMRTIVLCQLERESARDRRCGCKCAEVIAFAAPPFSTTTGLWCGGMCSCWPGNGNNMVRAVPLTSAPHLAIVCVVLLLSCCSFAAFVVSPIIDSETQNHTQWKQICKNGAILPVSATAAALY